MLRHGQAERVRNDRPAGPLKSGQFNDESPF